MRAMSSSRPTKLVIGERRLVVAHPAASGGCGAGGGRGRGRRGQLAAEDGHVHRLQLRRRVDPELVGEPGPEALVGPKGVGLAPGAGKGAQQLAAEPLRQRVGGHQLLELGHQLLAGPGGQVGLDAVLQGVLAQVVQARGGRPGEGGRGRVGKGRSPPQGQGLGQQLPGPLGVAAQPFVAGPGQGLEADGVDGLGGHVQPVAARLRLQHARQQPPQTRDQRLEGVGGLGRRPLVPDGVDQLGGGHHPARVEGQAQQQPPQPRPGDLHGQPGAGPHLQRAKDGDAQVPGHAPILPRTLGRMSS